MYKKVISEDSLKEFNQIVEKNWIEKGYDVEHATLDSDCYIIYNDEEVAIGTIEFKTVTVTSEILRYFPFLFPQDTIEVDKVSILKEHRSTQNLSKILELFFLHAQENNPEKYISLLEPNFFHHLKNQLHFPVEAMSEKIFYKGDYVIPMMMPIRKMQFEK
ncbi:hypothetical protein EEL32_06625 [Brevibacillus laterosporus]|nr:hypothetical protein [Brevibacillus laterosporus]TPG89135.1 hypothetical protein EEL32_06625 [Brevibacillus laterosporus]